MDYELRPEGKIKITQEGLYTVVDAEIPASESLLRLYACGNNKIVSVGLIPPSGRLSKKFSKIQMEALPEKILYFFTLGYNEEPPENPARAEKTEKNPAAGADEKKPMWEQLPDGSMRTEKAGFTYIALPARLRKSAAGIRLIRYEGQEYMVFRY